MPPFPKSATLLPSPENSDPSSTGPLASIPPAPSPRRHTNPICKSFQTLLSAPAATLPCLGSGLTLRHLPPHRQCTCPAAATGSLLECRSDPGVVLWLCRKSPLPHPSPPLSRWSSPGSGPPHSQHSAPATPNPSQSPQDAQRTRKGRCAPVLPTGLRIRDPGIPERDKA